MYKKTYNNKQYIYRSFFCTFFIFLLLNIWSYSLFQMEGQAKAKTSLQAAPVDNNYEKRSDSK